MKDTLYDIESIFILAYVRRLSHTGQVSVSMYHVLKLLHCVQVHVIKYFRQSNAINRKPKSKVEISKAVMLLCFNG